MSKDAEKNKKEPKNLKKRYSLPFSQNLPEEAEARNDKIQIN